MKSLFRSIRQKLFNEGKLVRYLGYAVGEITLIIIGIMMALQLNNWNESRKAQTEFELYILQLREDVREARSNSLRSGEAINDRISQQENIEVILKLKDYSQEDILVFENALLYLPQISKPRVHIGSLGNLLNGDIRVIRRDQELAQKAVLFENEIKWILNVLEDHTERMRA